MGIEHPSPEVVRAIEARSRGSGPARSRESVVKAVPAPGTPKGSDNVVIADPAAPPLWARFYELGTNRPIFCGRDSVVKYSMAEIEYERRNGYRWYVDRPARLLDTDYPEWLRKHRP